MKILSYQSFSLYSNSGGSRILRRLYHGHEPDVSSLTFTASPIPPIKGDIQEKIVLLKPLIRSWMRWKIRKWVRWLRRNVFRSTYEKNIRNAASQIPFDVLHIVDHDKFSILLCDGYFLSGRPLWVSFHDHFLTTGSSFNITNKLWNSADRRLVIGKEMGKEYSRLFADKSFEIITDGLFPDEISEPAPIKNETITIYFAGLLHIAYLPLLETLTNALDILSKEGLKIKFILRGTQFVKFLDQRSFEVEFRPFTTNQDELKQELDSASILYLPIKFKPAEFYLYSLSTKMVGYLGSPGCILYHGPADSSAFNLLNEFDAAIGCYTLNTDDMVESLYKLLNEDCKVSYNAKKLAKNHFDFEKIKKRFWEPK